MQENKSQTKKVLFYTRPLSPPWDEASKNLAFEIIKNSTGKVECLPLTTTEVDHFENIPQAKISPEKIYTSNSMEFSFTEKIQLLKRLYKFSLKTDIIHFLFTPRSITSLLIRLRLFFSKVKTVQTIATISDNIINKKRKLKKILFADKIIIQSNVTRSKLEKIGIKNTERIYPGIDLEKYQPNEKDAELLKYFNLTNNDLIILFAGEYTRLKAIDDIVSAFEIIAQKDPQIKLILACRIKSKDDTKKKKEVQENVNKKGLKEKIIFIDTFANMPALFNLSDINIFPVREMAGKFDIPLAVIEPMACGKPVIVSDIPVLEEFVKNNKTGIVVEKQNPTQLAETVLELKNNPEKMKEIGENARKFCEENFDIKKVAQKYEDIYLSL